jgi:hypothetical protein
VIAIVTSIAQSAQILAVTAIDDATAASRSHDIADAQNDLSAADRDFAAGDYRGVIRQFEDAWKDATKGALGPTSNTPRHSGTSKKHGTASKGHGKHPSKPGR